MQFQVPQFIEIEDRIIGPFTFKQFLYLAGSAGLAYIAWRFLPLFIAAPLMLGIGSLGAAFAFMDFNGRPFILAVEHGFFYLLHPKLYLWDAERKTREKKALSKEKTAHSISVPKLSDSKLHELAWSLDIKKKMSEEDARGSIPGTSSPIV